MTRLDESKSEFLIEKANQVDQMRKDIEVLNESIGHKPENLESLLSKKRELERALEKEYGSIQSEANRISRIIQSKEADLMSVPERQTKIKNMAFLLGKVGFMDDAEGYASFADELQSTAPTIEEDLEKLSDLYEELTRREKRDSDRYFHRYIDKEMKHTWAIWRKASRGESYGY